MKQIKIEVRSEVVALLAMLVMIIMFTMALADLEFLLPRMQIALFAISLFILGLVYIKNHQECAYSNQENARLSLQASIAKNMAYATILIDPATGMIVYANRKAHETLKYNPHNRELLNMNSLLLGFDFGMPLTSFLEHVRSCDLRYREATCALIRNNGEEFDANIRCVFFEHDNQEYILCQFRNVSESRKQKRELKEESEELKQRITRLEKMIAFTLHDLKNKLSVASGFCELILEKEGLDNQLKEYANAAYSSLNKIVVFISEYLDIRANNMGASISIKLKKIDLFSAMLTWKEHFMIAAHYKRIAVTATTANDIPGITSDKDRIARALENLVVNAIKYTQEGGQIEIHTTADHINRLIIFSVKDNGQGIDPSEINKVFEEYYRTEDGKKRHKGHGIGLSVVRNIAKRLGGDAWAESEGISHGSTFYFSVAMEIDMEG